MGPEGVVLPTPALAVDRILDVLAAVKLIDGISLEQHYGFEPKQTPGVFRGCGFELEVDRKFQLGLNRLFVFRRTTA